MVKYLCNAFSLQMVADNADIRKRKVSTEEAASLVKDAESAIGHADTAYLVGKQLGREVSCNRVNVSLKSGDAIVVAQYRGPRLAEGTTVLPEGAVIEYFTVEVL